MESCLARAAVRWQNLTRERDQEEEKSRDELGQAEAKLGPPLRAIIRAAGEGFPCRSSDQLRFDRWIDLSSSLD